MTEKFRIRVQKDSFVFTLATSSRLAMVNANGFTVTITKCGSNCAADLDINHYVFDFIALRNAVQRIVATLDHRMLLPAHHPTIIVVVEPTEVVVRYLDRRWVFPREECVILPVANTTTELLAKHVADQLRDVSRSENWPPLRQLSVGIDENHGQWGIYEWSPD